MRILLHNKVAQFCVYTLFLRIFSSVIAYFLIEMLVFFLFIYKHTRYRIYKW